jgi:hypothetical protein
MAAYRRDRPVKGCQRMTSRRARRIAEEEAARAAVRLIESSLRAAQEKAIAEWDGVGSLVINVESRVRIEID